MDERMRSGTGGRGPDSHLDEHLCLDLIQGFVPPAEAKKILEHLSVCPACEKLLQERAAEDERNTATRTIRTAPGGKIVLEKRGSSVRGRERSENRLGETARRIVEGLAGAFHLPRYQLAGAVAAAAVVVLVLVWPRTPEIARRLELQVLPSYSFQLESRDVPESRASEDLKAGLLAYDHREFKRAADLLQGAQTSEMDEVNRTIRQIYLGSALVWRGRHEEAVEVLKSVSFMFVPGEWGREAQWTMYVALKGAGREASADSLLEVVAKKPNEIGERARRLMER